MSVRRKDIEEKADHHTMLQIRLDDAYYSGHPAELEERLQVLNDLLGPVGVSVTAGQEMTVDIHMEKLYTVTNRRAGRKKKKTGSTWEEIMAYRETHTAIETAEWLGLTRQTFYRKIREHKAAGHDMSVEF